MVVGTAGWSCRGQRQLVVPSAAYPFPSVSLQVVMVLKKEVMKTQNRELDKGPEYRQLLVQVGCAVCKICVNLPLQACHQ